MNKRQKKKQIKIRNKELIKEYPFLLPRNVWTGEILKDYDYSFTELDCMPEGWKKAFGKLLCEDIKKELIKANFLDKYRICEIKEKYGTLRWYDFGAPEEVTKILYKYEHISEYTCATCGKVNVPIYNSGWILPQCTKCFEKKLKEMSKWCTIKESNSYKISEPLLTPTFEMVKYSNKVETIEVYDCSEILKRMNVDIKNLPSLDYLKSLKDIRKDI